MSVNKVVFGNEVKMDLTNDTVSADNLLEGETAHDRSGTPVTGTAKQGHVIQNKNGTDLTQRLKLQFGDGLNASDDSTNSKTKVGVDTTFTEASTRANINSGDTFSTILGKIKKWFTDIPSLFVSKSGDTMTGNLGIVKSHSGTTSVASQVALGNTTPDGTAGASHGVLSLFGKSNRYASLRASNITGSNKDIELPNKSGTLATTDDVNTRVSKSGDTMSGGLMFSGVDLTFGTTGSNSDDSGDLVFTYGNGNEKARIWAADNYSDAKGLNYRLYSKDGTGLYYGRLATLGDIPSLSAKTVTISINALSPLGEAYDQDYSWSATYTILGIVGYQLEGGYYTRCFFSRMSFRNGASKHIYYSVRNSSDTLATGVLTLTVQLLVMSN